MYRYRNDTNMLSVHAFFFFGKDRRGIVSDTSELRGFSCAFSLAQGDVYFSRHLSRCCTKFVGLALHSFLG